MWKRVLKVRAKKPGMFEVKCKYYLVMEGLVLKLYQSYHGAKVRKKKHRMMPETLVVSSVAELADLMKLPVEHTDRLHYSSICMLTELMSPSTQVFSFQEIIS